MKRMVLWGTSPYFRFHNQEQRIPDKKIIVKLFYTCPLFRAEEEAFYGRKKLA